MIGCMFVLLDYPRYPPNFPAYCASLFNDYLILFSVQIGLMSPLRHSKTPNSPLSLCFHYCSLPLCASTTNRTWSERHGGGIESYLALIIRSAKSENWGRRSQDLHESSIDTGRELQ
ncbi:hypothetical protein N7G274_001201 [Stereocaulon virgatum]|uniref:Uncharacterized protein n=1 Tax=Stereocaulon virgatum TaxID=373712 RepID=A0ABR4AN63_9LECA